MERYAKDGLVLEGPDESSPAPSAGLMFSYATRPGRDDRSLLALVVLRATKAKHFYRPWRDGRVFLHQFPTTSCRATFIGSLRDQIIFPSFRLQPNLWLGCGILSKIVSVC
jgi:hypothetical protein